MILAVQRIKIKDFKTIVIFSFIVPTFNKSTDRHIF